MQTPTPAQLRDALGISPSYASMIANGSRTPPMPLALRIRQSLGVKMGPLESVDDDDIPALERAHGVAPPADAAPAQDAAA